MDLQQQVQGMGAQLTSLEASLKASDAQAGSLRQELASLGNSGPPTFKVNGTEMNGSASANLPKGYYYTLADQAPASAAAQEGIAWEQSQSGVPAEGSGSPGVAASHQSGDRVVVPDEMHSTASTADASTAGPILSSDQDNRRDEALLVGDGKGALGQSSDSSSTQQRAAQPGMVLCTHQDTQSLP